MTMQWVESECAHVPINRNLRASVEALSTEQRRRAKAQTKLRRSAVWVGLCLAGFVAGLGGAKVAVELSQHLREVGGAAVADERRQRIDRSVHSSQVQSFWRNR